MNPKDLEKYHQYYYSTNGLQIKLTYLYETINGYIFESEGKKHELSYSTVKQYIYKNVSNLNGYTEKEYELYNEGVIKGIQLGFELAQKWIPTSKTLPNVNEIVLVISKNLNVYLCYTDKKGNFYNANTHNKMTITITHWMYLELPK